MDVASGRSTKVSARKGLNTGAAWAPDGQSVALTLNVGDNMDIHRIDLSGKIMDRFTNSWGINVSPSFSPDGTKVAFVSNRSEVPKSTSRISQAGGKRGSALRASTTLPPPGPV